MPYDPASTGRFCRSCGTREDVGHSAACWKADVIDMTDVTATCIKIGRMIEVENAATEGQECEAEALCKACTKCGRARFSSESQSNTVDCWCGSQEYDDVPCEDAIMQIQNWLEEQGKSELFESAQAAMAARSPPDSECDEGEEDTDTDDTEEEDN